VKVLSFDPGETTGWAYQDERDDFPGGIIDLGQISGIQQLSLFLNSWTRPVDHVTIEDYTVWGGNRGDKANKGSKLETVRAVGVIESFCYVKGIPFTKYDSQDVTLYSMKVGLDPRKGAHKNTHWAFAAVYGRWYLVFNKLAKSALQLDRLKRGR